MANRFWVGGTGNWDATTTHWSTTSGGATGASVPTASDTACFDGNSGGGIVTVSGSRTCLNLDLSGTPGATTVWVGTMTGTSTPVLTISGALVGGTYSTGALATVSFIFNATSSVGLALASGSISGLVTINGVGGTFTMSTALSFSGGLTITNGTFSTGNNALNFSGSATAFSLGSGTKTITLGSSTVTFTSGCSFSFATNTSGLTYNTNTSSIVLNSGGSSVQHNFGGLTHNKVSVTACTGGVTILGANTFTNFIIPVSAATASTVAFAVSTTNTFTNFICEGQSSITHTLSSSLSGTATTLSVASGTTLITYTSIKDITASGGASFFAGTHSTSVSGNTGITFTGPGFVKGSYLGGSWSTVTCWADGVLPTAADPVRFNATTQANITANSGSCVCRSLDCTGYAFQLGTSTNVNISIGDASGGSLTFSSTMTTNSGGGTSAITFVSTTSGNTITSNGITISISLNFNGVSGVWTLQDNITSGASASITLTNGSLNTNGKTLNGFNFSSSNSNTRSLTLGATSWTVPGSWDVTTSTGMTLSAASSTITTNATSANMLFNGGGLTYGTLSFTTLTTAFGAITGSNTFGTLTLSMGATTKTNTSGYKFTAGTTQTVTGTFTANGNTTILRNFLYSSVKGTAITISAATVSVTHTDFRDITGSGAGSWNFSALTTTANGDCGGNSGITFTTPKNCFWKSNTTANWSATNWFTTSGGSTAIVPSMPLVHDTTAAFDANSAFTAGKTITLDVPRIPKVDWTGVPGTPAWATGSTVFECYGSLILVSGMTHTGTGNITLCGRGSYTFDGGTLTWPTTSAIIVDCVNSAGTYSLARNLTTNAGITPTSGSLNNNGFAISCSTFQMNGGTWSGTGAITVTASAPSVNAGTMILGGTLTLLSAAFAQAGGTLDMNGFNITGHTTFTFSGGTLNLSGQINCTSNIAVSVGTINDTGPLGELKGTGISFTSGTSTVRKLTLSSTFAISSTASLTIPAGGSATWATSWTNTGTTYSLKFGGAAKYLNNSLTVASGYIPTLEGL